MKIAILGAGKVGTALGKAWARAGHDIIFGVRKPEEKNELLDIGQVTQTKEAANEADVILVALPIPAIVPVAKEIGDQGGKILIDATNSVFAKPEPYQNGLEAFKGLSNARVAKGFNTTGFENMENPIYNGKGIDMFTAGTDREATDMVKNLALDAGFEKCYHFGGDDKVALIEQFAFTWINLAIMQGEGRNMAFKILKR